MDTNQITMFDRDEALPEPVSPKPESRDPDDMCLVYLVTKSGGNRGNLFVLPREDAQKLCEDECSHGVARGGQWMFQWTSLSHFYDSGDRSAADRQARDTHGKLTPFVFIRDTGKQDKDFERLGIKKPDINDISTLLRRLGYEMKYESSKERLIDQGLLSEKDFEETEKMLQEKRRKQ